MTNLLVLGKHSNNKVGVLLKNAKEDIITKPKTFSASHPEDYNAYPILGNNAQFLFPYKACFNMTPKEYLRHLRLQEASHLVIRINQTFAQISHHCEFLDQAHISREFSRILKDPPVLIAPAIVFDDFIQKRRHFLQDDRPSIVYFLPR